jgi:hypothetical protein
MFCKYRHIFGEERKGFHSYRFLDIAIGDFLLTATVSLCIAYMFNVTFHTTLLVALFIGILAHRLFCVNTKLNSIIFGQV